MNTNIIVFFVGKLNVGGAGKMVKYVANVSKEVFNEVHVVSFYEKIDYDVDGVSYHGLGLNTTKKFWRLSALRSIRSIVLKLHPNVCCSFVSDIAVMTRIATLSLNGVIFVSAERGDPYTLPKLWKSLVVWTYTHSDYCLFQLPKARDFFGKKVIDKSFVIPNPYLGTGVNPYYGQRKKTIVTAIRFEKEKGVDLLINAFANIHDDFPEYKLIIYGAGSLLSQYKEIVKTHNIDDFVSFPGYVNNIAEIVREEGIFVLPSRYEGIPNNLIEVLSVGIPAISADCSPGGPRFLLRGGESGLLFPVNDQNALEVCLRRVIKDEKLYKELQERGSEILEEIAEPKIRMKWIKTFEKITQ